jgi:tetratricopeptide (TPR) repeat protein
VASTLLIPRAVHAQAEQPGDGKEIELDDGTADEGPVTAGQMTEEAARGKQLFDAERWGEAAPALERVVDGDTDDDRGNRQIAQYHLGIALYRLHFYEASYGIFAEIADKPSHLKFNETMLWLARLAIQLPEPADIVERLGKYGVEQLARFDNPQQRDLYSQVSYLLGKYKHRNRSYEEAIRLFEKVEKGSKQHAEAQLWMGVSYVQLGKAAPAARSFQRIVQGIDEHAPGAARMRDLAFLSIARIHYSAGVRIGESGAPVVNPRMLAVAIDHWGRVEAGGELWLDALFEQSWAYFMAGDSSRALGNIHTLQSPYFPGAYYPEADILKAVISFTHCHSDDAATIAAETQKKYDPVAKELEATLGRFNGEASEEQFFRFLKDVRGGTTSLSPATRLVVEHSLSDRQLLRHLEYIRGLDEEGARLRKAPAEFRDTPLGDDVADAVSLARDIAVRNAGALARERCQRALDELKEHLRDARNLREIAGAEHGLVERGFITGRLTKRETITYAADGIDGAASWPFDGEYWLDELGTYRQKVTPICGK